MITQAYYAQSWNLETIGQYWGLFLRNCTPISYNLAVMHFYDTLICTQIMIYKTICKNIFQGRDRFFARKRGRGWLFTGIPYKNLHIGFSKWQTMLTQWELLATLLISAINLFCTITLSFTKIQTGALNGVKCLVMHSCRFINIGVCRTCDESGLLFIPTVFTYISSVNSEGFMGVQSP